MTIELFWVIFLVDIVPVLVAIPFLIPGTKGFSLGFWQRAARDVRRGVPVVWAALRRDARAEGVPLRSRLRRVVFAVPEVARASCYSMAAVLAEVDPGDVEMRLWRPVFDDMHPVIEFVGGSFAMFLMGVFVFVPPSVNWEAHPVLAGFWVLQGGAFVVAVVGDFVRLGRGVVSGEDG